ncbi:MAG: flagellar basal-body MS-ring/collar protein FliF [Oscillospiraceae bacterium]
MDERVKGIPVKLKAFWNGIGKGAKRLIVISLAVLIAAAAAISIFLNNGETYVALFPGMDSSETADVYGILKDKGVDTKYKDGQLSVPESQWDELVFELAQLGYPKTSLSYSTYFDNLSITMTDEDKWQVVRIQLEERLQQTLTRIDNIRDAAVSLNIPVKSDYVWEENESKPSASVTLTLRDPSRFTAANVQAVKNLVAYSADAMEPADVTVIDTTSGRELSGTEDSGTDDYTTGSRENYERLFKNNLEEAAENILSVKYGTNNVVAVASVTLDYDKVEEEVKQYTDGQVESEHVINDKDGSNSGASGVNGEESNTDIPSYQDDSDAASDADYYERETENAVSYILTHTEKAQGVLKDASISIVVKSSEDFTSTDQDEVRSLVKNATNIVDADKITVVGSKLTVVADDDDPTVVGTDSGASGEELLRKYIWVIFGAVAALIALMVTAITLMSSKSKKKIRKTIEASRAAVESMEIKVEETKRRSLSEQASEANSGKKRTEDDVKSFAKQNPDLAAAIIRSMIKEEE